MAKRPSSRSQADDTAAGTPTPSRARRARAAKAAAPTAPGAPVPPDTQAAARADSADDRGVDLDPGSRPEALDTLTSESGSTAWQPTEDDIRTRAYHRYLERGGGHGMEFDDWLEAERELRVRT